MPKISVIMPVYNAEKYLREAIDSILSQTYGDFEFIIIDDGSKDSSPDIVRSYTDNRIKFYINEHNMGVAATLNRGLDLAEGEYIARMDSDDISMPDRFKKQVEYLDSNLDVGVLGCSIETFGEGLEPSVYISPSSKQGFKADLFFASCLAHPSVMIRKSAMGDHRYEEDYNGLEDYVLWWRIARNHNIYSLKEVLFKYRLHKNQVTQKQIHSDAFCEKFKSFLIERISVFEIEYTEEELSVLYKYSLSAVEHPSSCDEIDTFINFLNKLLDKNKDIAYFDQKCLRHVFGLATSYIVNNSNLNKKQRLFYYRTARSNGVLDNILFLKLLYHWVTK